MTTTVQTKPRGPGTFCGQPADFLMFWPGRPRSPICAYHAEKAKVVASAMGFDLALEVVDDDESAKCQQNIMPR